MAHWFGILKYPPKTLPFLSCGDATKHLINQISHILSRSTSQPPLQILPSPLMLPRTQSENLQLKNIPSIPVPAPRAEPFSQPLRVQTHQSSPTTPPRVQPSASPSLDPHTNLWIKIYKIFEDTPDFQSQENTSVTPESSTPLTPFPTQL